MNGLEQALLECMSMEQAKIHLKYYNDYIDSEIRSGKREEEVISGLGNPRLIVKSITEVSGDSFYEYTETQREENKEENMDKKFQIGKFTTDLKTIIGISVAIIVALILISIVTKIAWAILKLLIPVALIVFVARLIFKSLK